MVRHLIIPLLERWKRESVALARHYNCRIEHSLTTHIPLSCTARIDQPPKTSTDKICHPYSGPSVKWALCITETIRSVCREELIPNAM